MGTKKSADSAETLKKSLEETLDQAEWSWLRKHAERDGVIVVSASLSLLEVGVKIAQDDAAGVQAWIASGKISKPTREQLLAWNAEPTRKFLSLVVQPYVLIQENAH